MDDFAKHKCLTYHANSIDPSFWLQHIFIQELTFDELKVVAIECQLPMLLALRHINSETQKHVIGVFPCAKRDETSHIIDGTYSKCIMIPLVSDALDWCCGDGFNVSHAHEGFVLMPNKQTKRKIQKKVCAKGACTPHICFEALLRLY